MYATLLFHGDCDGVIAAGLYIRRFLRDLYPHNIILKFTQPWRASHDLYSLRSNIQSIDKLVLLDIALNEDLCKALRELMEVKPSLNIVFIDHHLSSKQFLEELYRMNVEVYWDQLKSTPQVLSKYSSPPNPYEQLLIRVANVCEGEQCNSEDLLMIADRIKLSLALDPLDISIFTDIVHSIVENKDFWNSPRIVQRYNKAKWLLSLLMKSMERKAVDFCGWKIFTYSLTESMLYAGLFGIAASEYSRKYSVPVLIVRDEGRKVVITVRAQHGKALEVCKTIAEYAKSKGISSSFGGHAEAASITLQGDKDLQEIVYIIEGALRNFCYGRRY